jgi:DNA methylase
MDMNVVQGSRAVGNGCARSLAPLFCWGAIAPSKSDGPRRLKKTGSFYYHCDWHASHYVKVMLDQIFGENQFLNEIVWKRTHAHGSADRFAPIHDVIFFYSVGQKYTWTNPRLPIDNNYVAKKFTKTDDKTGKLFQDVSLTGSGTRNGESGKPWRGVDPTRLGRHWAIPGEVMKRHKLAGVTVQDRLDALDASGLIYWPRGGDGVPRLKFFADELGGTAIGTVWADIAPINSQARESLGYPTQKPLPLLERIIEASTYENDLVLDAFCGCGTALVAAQKLKRQWIGIDISPTACRVMAKRLKKDCGLKEDEKLQQIGRGFVVRDLPKTEAELRKYPPFEFENWAVVALGGTKNARQVGDMGIDGRIYPVSAMPERRGAAVGEMDFMDEWFPIQVKQKDKVGRPEIDAFEAVMIREERKLGYFVGFDFTGDALFEIDRFRRKEGREIKPLTVREILDQELSVKS